MFDIVPKALHFLAERKCFSVLSNGITHYDKVRIVFAFLSFVLKFAEFLQMVHTKTFIF